MRTAVAALALLVLAACAYPGDDPAPPAPPATPAPEPVPADSEGRKVLEAAAKRQGTAALTGEKAVARFLARFATIFVLDEEKGNHQLDRAVQAFALPAEKGRKAKVHSEAVADGQSEKFGFDGKVHWLWRKKDGVRRLTDPFRDRADIAEVDDRSRLLRLALRVFFLGNFATDRAPVTLLPDADAEFPVGREGKTRKVACRVLERAADADAGEPAVRLHLDAKTLDPVAATFVAAGEKDAGWLLVVEFDPDQEQARAQQPGAVPEGMRVPTWIEMFEVPPGAKPVIRVQATVDELVIDPARVPDSLFEAPR